MHEVETHFAGHHYNAAEIGATISDLQNKSPHKFDETMPFLDQIMIDKTPETKHRGLLITLFPHYNDVIMGAITSQITSLTNVYSIIYSYADQRKHQSAASLAFVRGIHRGPVNVLD